MAVAGIQITAEIAELRELQQALGRIFTPADKARILRDALKKALAPALERLKQNTPEGPTGNLKRAASIKIVPYTRNGNAVGLLGYRRAGQGSSEAAQGGRVRKGPDRAFHQWWLEEGTQERVIDTATPPRTYERSGYTKPGFSRGGFQVTRKGKTFRVASHRVSGHAVTAHRVKQTKSSYYASSYNELGEFTIQKFRLGEKGFVTSPAYPNAFFKRSSNPIRLPAVRPGGESGRPPLKTTWEQTSTTVAEILQRELRISLERALQTLFRSSRGTIDTFGA